MEDDFPVQSGDLVGGFKHLFFSPLSGEMIQLD